MKRRESLAILGSGSLIAVAGCVSSPGDDSDAVDQSYENTIRTRTLGLESIDELAQLYVGEDVLTGELADRKGHPFEWQWEDYTLITDAETAVNGIEGGETIDEFIEGTDFSDSFVVVVQNGMQTDAWLEFGGSVRDGDRFEITVSIDGPDLIDDEIGAHSLLLRFSGAGDTVPEELSVDFEEYL